MPIIYVGKTLSFKGKSLWEIVGNLKNFGVGRIVVRSMKERYPEPSYMKIVKVETLATPISNTPDEIRKVKVWVENTFRGKQIPGIQFVEKASYKADYRLLSKDEEADYCKCDNPRVKIKVLPRTMNFPPLLRELIIQEIKRKGEAVAEEPQLEIVYKCLQKGNYRIAEEGEVPDIKMDNQTLASSPVYKNIQV